MKISDLIVYLENAKENHGDLPVCTTEDDEYWGTLESYVDVYSLRIRNAKPNGPKNESELCLVIG